MDMAASHSRPIGDSLNKLVLLLKRRATGKAVPRQRFYGSFCSIPQDGPGAGSRLMVNSREWYTRLSGV